MSKPEAPPQVQKQTVCSERSEKLQCDATALVESQRSVHGRERSDVNMVCSCMWRWWEGGGGGVMGSLAFVLDEAGLSEER